MVLIPFLINKLYKGFKHDKHLLWIWRYKDKSLCWIKEGKCGNIGDSIW